MNWKNVKLVFHREVRDQLRDRRTLFMITILPVLLYPMLGLGVVEMMLTFSEQKRTVVVLNADELPTTPAFLDETGIMETWFPGGHDDAARLQIITDLPKDEVSGQESTGRSKRQLSPEKLLENGRALAANFSELQGVTDTEDRQAGLREIQDRLSDSFGKSGIQVLVMVPDGYAESIARLQSQDGVTEAAAESSLPPLQVIRNSADDKSAVAFARVQSALTRWEGALRSHTFAKAALRSDLQYPARLEWVEVARGDEVAANIWSKLFPE